MIGIEVCPVTSGAHVWTRLDEQPTAAPVLAICALCEQATSAADICKQEQKRDAQHSR